MGNFTDYVEPGRNGMRFRSGDPADLVRTLTDFFAAPDHAHLRTGARATFEQTFAAEPVLDLLERVYTELVDPGSAG